MTAVTDALDVLGFGTTDGTALSGTARATTGGFITGAGAGVGCRSAGERRITAADDALIGRARTTTASCHAASCGSPGGTSEKEKTNLTRPGTAGMRAAGANLAVAVSAACIHFAAARVKCIGVWAAAG